MNVEIVRAYLHLYKENFEELNRRELYKWKAVKTFKKHWNSSSTEFGQMLKHALSDTVNLVQAKKEFSMTRILHFAERDANFVQQMFLELFNENLDILQRIASFKDLSVEINNRFPQNDGAHHQNSRAIGAYLALHNPGKYYFYKTKMVREFFNLIDYPVQINQKKNSKFTIYYRACEILRDIIQEDQDLVAMHLQRLDDSCYFDDTLHILTQDVIYAISVHFPTLGISLDGEIPPQNVKVNEWNKGDASKVSHKPHEPSFKGAHVDFEKSQKKNKNIGDKGELWVMDVERDKLRKAGMEKKAEQVEYIADTEGDGTGYDIRSYDAETGKEILIEVKATKGSWTTPFYITRNELLRSKQDPDKYRLYRVHNFNWEKQSGSIKEFRGDLEAFCQEPTQYVIKPKE